jgi:DNA-binding CsgD family transcriptional regulator
VRGGIVAHNGSSLSEAAMTNYERKLNELVDDIFFRFPKTMTLAEIAAKAKLSIATVWRLENRVTKLPRFKTVFALARAAGMEITLAAVKAKFKIA